MGYSDKYLLVKKAAKIDLDTDRGYVEFLKIAKESGLTKERLEYYTNAYAASGESGLRALSYRKRMPKDIYIARGYSSAHTRGTPIFRISA